MYLRHWTTVSLLAILASPAFSQTNTATVLGTVVDASGGLVVNARVSATNVETNLVRTGNSNADGAFRIESLPIGRYVVSAASTGFKTEVRGGIVLAAGDQLRLDFNLTLGDVSEKVEVTADAGGVNTQSAELGVVVTPQKVQSLPLNGRNFTQLVLLEPGVQTSAIGGRNSFSINGTTQWGINVTLDGTDASFPESSTFGDPSARSLLNTVSVDSIQEFRVQAANFSAETGRSSGGAVNVITKSGTNDFHGSLYEYLRNNRLDARNFFAARKDKLRLNQFGGTLGGPILRNKLFFFGNLEQSRRRVGQQLTGLTPSAEFRATAPAVYKPYLDLLPLPGLPLLNPNVGTARASNVFTDDEKLYNIRGDWVRDRSVTSARYSLNQSSNSIPYLMITNRQVFNISNHLATLSNTYNISPTTLNEFRAGLDRWLVPRKNLTYFGGLGQITVTSLLTDGNFEGLLTFADNTYNVADNLSRRMGRHTLKAGFELRRLQSNRIQVQNPVYTYNNLAQFLANTPAQVRVIFGNPGAGMRQWQSGYYLQDDWQLNSRLTVNLGVRYEYFSPLSEVAGRLFNTVSDPAGPWREKGQDTYSKDHNNFEPRLGIAWDVTGKQTTVLRSGFGFYSSPLVPYFAWGGANVSPFLPFAYNATPQDIPGLSFPLKGNIAASVADPYTALKLGIAPSVVGRYVIDPSLRDTYTMMWNFSLQQKLHRDLALQIDYVANHGLKAPNTRSVNLVDPKTGRRPVPTIGEIVILENSAKRSYNGLQVSLRKKISHGLFADLFYTWSHSLFYGGDDCCSGSTNNSVQDFDNVAGSRGSSGIDIRHKVTIDYGWNIPGPRSGAGKWILGGWAVEGITQFRTGLPLTIFSGQDAYGNGIAATQRVNFIGGSQYPDNQSISRWFNPAAFAVPARGTFGNIGYATARGPHQVNFDMSFAKRVPVWREHQIMFRAEMFNIFNHANFSNPVSTFTSPQFGIITAAADPRQIQLALKYQF